MNYEEILYKYHTNSIESNEMTYAKVLDDYSNFTDETFDFTGLNNYTDKVIKLKNYLYNTKHTVPLFNILRKYNYNFKFEIILAMLELCFLNDPNKNKEVIKKRLGSPCINDITFNSEKCKFSIYSEYGKFTFEVASHYFQNHKSISEYLRNNELRYECHKHSYYLSQEVPEWYAITSLCKYHFGEDFYHSYSYSPEENKIIDFSIKAVIDDKEEYDKIFQPKEISVILNSQVNKELEEVERNITLPDNWYELSKIAIYKQLMSYNKIA